VGEAGRGEKEKGNKGRGLGDGPTLANFWICPWRLSVCLYVCMYCKTSNKSPSIYWNTGFGASGVY